VTDGNKCEPGKHSPFHRGILGGYYCGECGAFDYDGTGEWMFSDEWAAAPPVQEKP
jgi:hypothetical protein